MDVIEPPSMPGGPVKHFDPASLSADEERGCWKIHIQAAQQFQHPGNWRFVILRDSALRPGSAATTQDGQAQITGTGFLLGAVHADSSLEASNRALLGAKCPQPRAADLFEWAGGPLHTKHGVGFSAMSPSARSAGDAGTLSLLPLLGLEISRGCPMIGFEIEKLG